MAIAAHQQQAGLRSCARSPRQHVAAAFPHQMNSHTNCASALRHSFATWPQAQPEPHLTLGRRMVIAAAGKPAAKGFGKPKKVDAGLDASLPCPCGTGKAHSACCQPYLTKQAKPATAEALLRSRYTAYALKNPEYIADTTHVESEEYTGSRSTYLTSVRTTQRRADWLGLEIHGQEAVTAGKGDETVITFTASYVLKDDKAGKRQAREEKSRFWRDPKSGQWWYMGSDIDFADGAETPDTAATSGPTLQLPSLPSLPSFKF